MAAADTLTFKTYLACTALASTKLIVHTGIGSTIRSFTKPRSASTMSDEEAAAEAAGEQARKIGGIVGIALCLIVLAWICLVARRAVDEEGEDTLLGGDSESPGSDSPPHSPRMRALGLTAFAPEDLSPAAEALARRRSLHGGFEEASIGVNRSASDAAHHLSALERTRLELKDEVLSKFR